MNRPGLARQPGQRIELRIGDLRIAGASRLEARRLADALPAALEAALAGRAAPPSRVPAADRLAQQIVAAIARAREGGA